MTDYPDDLSIDGLEWNHDICHSEELNEMYSTRVVKCVIESSRTHDGSDTLVYPYLHAENRDNGSKGWGHSTVKVTLTKRNLKKGAVVPTFTTESFIEVASYYDGKHQALEMRMDVEELDVFEVFKCQKDILARREPPTDKKYER